MCGRARAGCLVCIGEISKLMANTNCWWTQNSYTLIALETIDSKPNSENAFNLKYVCCVWCCVTFVVEDTGCCCTFTTKTYSAQFLSEYRYMDIYYVCVCVFDALDFRFGFECYSIYVYVRVFLYRKEFVRVVDFGWWFFLQRFFLLQYQYFNWITCQMAAVFVVTQWGIQFFSSFFTFKINVDFIDINLFLFLFLFTSFTWIGKIACSRTHINF